jgi:hypothetical protein
MWVKIGENIHPLESESVVRVRKNVRVRVTKIKHIRIMDKIFD